MPRRSVQVAPSDVATNCRRIITYLEVSDFRCSKMLCPSKNMIWGCEA